MESVNDEFPTGQSLTQQTMMHLIKNKNKASLSWTLKNISRLDSIVSPSFFSGHGNHEWQLRVAIPCSKWNDFFCESEYISVFLELKSLEKCKAKAEFTIYGRNTLLTRILEYQEFSDSEPSAGFPQFISIHDLKYSKHRFVTDKKLKMYCRVWIKDDASNYVVSSTPSRTKSLRLDRETFGYCQKLYCRKKLGTDKLASRMKLLLDAGNNSDVTIVTRTKEFPAHKQILQLHSPVFERMLNTEMQEMATNIVNIEDFDEETVATMLTYLYIGKEGDIHENALEVMKISEKYNIEGLKEIAEKTISKTLTKENAAELLIESYLHNASLLKQKAIQFMFKNKKDIKKTEAYLRLEKRHPEFFILY